MKTYTEEEIQKICDEIELQWNYHLLCRAIFYSGAGIMKTTYPPPSYYKEKGIDFLISFPDPMAENMKKSLEGIAAWLNQNYIIRLFGILNEHKVIKMGKPQKNHYTEILACLRHKVGAHSAGYKNSYSKESEDISTLIRNHLDPRVLSSDIQHFNLSIDTVLEPLKNHIMLFIKSLNGVPIPEITDNQKCC